MGTQFIEGWQRHHILGTLEVQTNNNSRNQKLKLTMWTFAKIGLVGLILLSSKMANAEECLAGNFFDEDTSRCLPCRPGEYQPEKGMTKCLKCPDNKFTNIAVGAKSVEDCKDEESFRCGGQFQNALNKSLECNPKNINAYCCNKWGWCGEGKKNCECDGCQDYRIQTTPATKNDKDDDKDDDANQDSPSTTSDCHNTICFDFPRGEYDHPAFLVLKNIYRWNTKFVKDGEMKNGRNIYKSIENAKDKYAMWWLNGYWMVGPNENRGKDSGFATAMSNEECPEKINYDWKYWDGYANSFRKAGRGMTVYKCE